MALIQQKQVDSLVADLDARVEVNGDTMTGFLTLSGAPTSDLHAATKLYVDGKVASSVTYKGGYNAATNTPDLDTAPAGILIGDMYTVTDAGTFFATALEVGDVLIAENDDPTTEAEWTVVNRDLDAASIKVSYESNADTNEYSDAEEAKVGHISVTQAVDLDTIESDTATNNAKDTNVSTALSVGTRAATTLAITSDGGADDVILPAASTTEAGLMTDAQFDKLDGIEALADVTDSTNVNTAGATMNTDADVSGNTYVLDEDNMVTDSATKLATQQSIKAYVDAAASGSPTIIEEDDTCPVTVASTNFNITLGTAPTSGIAGVVAVSINGVAMSAAELISVTTTTMVLNVPYAVDAADVVATRYF